VTEDLREHLQRAQQTAEKARRQIHFAAIVAEGLRRAGLQATLVGGAAVEFYTFGSYTTGDVDFVCSARGEEIAQALEGLGFVQEEDLRHWSHPQLPIPLEFPPGPAQIGSLFARAIQVQVEGLCLEMVALEDAILDRTIAAQEWRDAGCADQAVLMMIAHYDRIDWSLLHRRAAETGCLPTLQKLQGRAKRRLREAPR
jgi:predicted nucleotidyltransferase